MQTIIAGLVMVGAYAVGKFLKFSTELCMFVAVIGGAIAGGAGFDTFRHIAEGSVTYLDIGLIFVFATIFMNIIKESGGTNYIVRKIIGAFHNKRILMLILLMLVILVPGALTGAGSISVLVVGGTVAAALNAMGLSKVRISALIFIVAGLSAAAPPVNIWAMMTCAGTAISYVGFTMPLLVPILILGLFSVIYFGRGAKNIDKEKALSEIPDPKGLSGWSVAVRFCCARVLAWGPKNLAVRISGSWIASCFCNLRFGCVADEFQESEYSEGQQGDCGAIDTANSNYCSRRHADTGNEF